MFEIRRHGSSYVLQANGVDVEPRVYVRDATSGDNILQLLNDSAGASKSAEPLWTVMAPDNPMGPGLMRGDEGFSFGDPDEVDGLVDELNGIESGIDLDDPDNLTLLLWSALAGEEDTDAPEDLHTHGEHVGEGLIVIHSHPFEEGVDHHHEIVISRSDLLSQPVANAVMDQIVKVVDGAPTKVVEGGAGTPNPPAGDAATSHAGEASSEAPTLGLPEGSGA